MPPAIRAGFSYHHAEESYVTLTLPLVEGTYIPPHASHYIGVGGVAINEDRELLVVSELYHSRRRSKPFYKLPGGALRAGEHVSDGIVREVEEETGIRTRFESMVCFRQWHGYRFGKSDIYFVCRLTPLNTRHPASRMTRSTNASGCLWTSICRRKYVWEFNKNVSCRPRWQSEGMVQDNAGRATGTPTRFEWFMPQCRPNR